AWIGEQLAASGIDSYEHRQVGDNQDRLVAALGELLRDADAVVVCGGIGPTPDDITRQAVAEFMGVPLRRHDELIAHIASLFGSRGREMPENNLRQADVPEGAAVIPNLMGTAPGLMCPIRGKIVYVVPGVPYEMQAMFTETVLPDLRSRTGDVATIRSRSLKTWGASESGLAEMIADRVDAQSNPTIAFLARGIEGLYVRMTAKAPTPAEAEALIEAEERELRSVLGDLVFAVDDETMESVVLDRLRKRGWTLGVAESLTGGQVGSRLADAPGASDVYRGSVATYASDVKRSVLGVTASQVVSEECARQMAMGVQRVLGADVGISVTGVAGPTPQDDQPIGTVCFGLAVPAHEPEAVSARLPGDRIRIRQFSTISLLNLLRMRLDALD
ncbi:MAG: competence/damage-inducible protein A, partial [Acidimicrobiia bacterium]